jgi:hypothetical protein
MNKDTTSHDIIGELKKYYATERNVNIGGISDKRLVSCLTEDKNVIRTTIAEIERVMEPVAKYKLDSTFILIGKTVIRFNVRDSRIGDFDNYKLTIQEILESLSVVKTIKEV